MASKNMSVAAQVPGVNPPEGFRRVGSAPDAGWFNMKKVGNSLTGTFEGMYAPKGEKKEDRETRFFQIRITSGETEVRIGRGEDATLTMVGTGAVVNLNWGPKVKELEDLVPDYANGAEFMIYGIVAGEKIVLRDKRTMHNFVLYKKTLKEPTVSTETDPDTDAPPF